MVIFGVIETLAACDWFMGLDWRWASSLFGVYHFAVCAQAGMAACIVIIAWMQSHGLLGRLNHEHYHLAGKLLFGFSIFWAYIAFGQFLLIWYANIPEETIFYNDHNRCDWEYLTYFLIVGKFMFPVIYLLAQDTKRSLRPLVTIALWILFMHVVEMYWFIAPYAHIRTHRAELAGLRRVPHRRLDPRLRLYPHHVGRLHLPRARPAPGRMPHRDQLT